MEDLVRLVTTALIALATIARGTAAAQEHVALRTDVLLYGDNTEFRNPFREGETIFGAAARVSADLEASARLTLSLGVLTNQRFGSDDAFELVRPVIALTVRGARSSFVFGTLPAPRAAAPMGPDRGGPHVLLPPLQRETLSFDRPNEAGLQWSFTGSRIHHEMWLEWQRLNTAAHRERLDAGVNAEIATSGPVSVPVQLHVVHQGGQLFAAGPVADSVAAAAGVKLSGVLRPRTRGSIEAYAVVSRYVPDRALPNLSRDGTGFFGRAAAERSGWRAHLIVWRGRNFIKDEGDPNYLAVTRVGGRYHGTRDYAELGGARRFLLAPGASLELSARLHRVERYYEYSYRVSSTVNLFTRIR
jgi:hypothetical protein